MSTSETITRNDLTAILNEVGFGVRDMTAQEVSDFVDALNVTGINAVDYVVEQGTSGDWSYRKWNSGIMECWGTYTASIAITTSSANYGGYRSGLITATAFPVAFTATPVITAVAQGAGGYWVNNVADSNTTNAKFYLSCGTSHAASDKSISIHACGKWK